MKKLMLRQSVRAEVLKNLANKIMSSVTVVTFYKVVSIQNVHKLKRQVERIAFKEKLSGTFFATPQGINTTLAGNRKGLEKLISLLKDNFLIKGLEPTWSESFKTPFKRLKVRIKDKLLPLEGNFDIFELEGNHVEPEDWNDLLEDPKAIVLDVRNEYETRIGSFKNSLIPETKYFTDLPEYIQNNKEVFKNKKIAMFCTGGIRCEIASSFFMSEGFEEVYQLNGGVLNYFDKVNIEDQLWKGECFVFDERVSVNPDLEEGKFEQCFGCRRPISNEDICSKKYKKGVSCPYCYDTSSDEDKTRFAQRQKQIELAESKGLKHMGKSVRK